MKRLGTAAAIISIVSAGYFIGSLGKDGFPEPITVQGKTITFTHTDDNTSEDFHIFTDQETYDNGLAHAEVYVAVQNVSGVEQDVELLAYFRDNKKKIEDIKVLEAFTKTSSTSDAYQVCTEEQVQSTTTKRTATTSVCVTEYENEQIVEETVYEWTDVPLIGRDPAEVSKENERIKDNPVARKSVGSFTAPRKSQGITLPADGILYYKVLIHYPPNQTDEFYFEAIGAKGGYSHLK